MRVVLEDNLGGYKVTVFAWQGRSSIYIENSMMAYTMKLRKLIDHRDWKKIKAQLIPQLDIIDEADAMMKGLDLGLLDEDEPHGGLPDLV